MREALLLEHPAQAHLREISHEALAQHPLEIDATPARHPVAFQIGSGLHQTLEFLSLSGRSLGLPLGRLAVDQAIGA